MSSFETGSKPNANDKCVLSGKSCNGDRGPIHFSGKIYLFHIIEKKINEDTAWSVPFLPTRPLWIRMLQACSMYGKLSPPPRHYPQKYYYMIWLNDSINYRGDNTSESYFSCHEFGQVFVLKKEEISKLVLLNNSSHVYLGSISPPQNHQLKRDPTIV